VQSTAHNREYIWYFGQLVETLSSCYFSHTRQRCKSCESSVCIAILSPMLIDSYDSNGELIPGQWIKDGEHSSFANVRRLSGNRHSRAAAAVRKDFANYFVSHVSEVMWQYRRVQSTGPSR